MSGKSPSDCRRRAHRARKFGTVIDFELLRDIPALARHQGINVEEDGRVVTLHGTVDVSREAILRFKASQLQNEAAK